MHGMHPFSPSSSSCGPLLDLVGFWLVSEILLAFFQLTVVAGKFINLVAFSSGADSVAARVGVATDVRDK